QTQGMTLEVRTAEPADAAQIADVHVRTWQHAYRGLMPDALLDALDPAARAARWERILAGEDVGGRGTNNVAVVDGRVVGFSTSGAARDDEAPTPLELFAIYVDPASHGTGVATPLLDAAIGE